MLFEPRLLRILACLSLALALGACATTEPKLPNAASIPVPETAPRVASAAPTAKPVAKPVTIKTSDRSVDGLISAYSMAYAVPESLVRRVVKRESGFNPAARNGPYMGLMQMLPATARAMGHEGSARDLLDAETNLKYGVKYLAGAYKVADNNPDQAVRLYSRGYYYQAKRKGLLEETGLKPSATSVVASVVFEPSASEPVVAKATTTEPMSEATAPAPEQLAYSGEQVTLPQMVPTPMQRPETTTAIMVNSTPTTGENGVQARVPAPL